MMQCIRFLALVKGCALPERPRSTDLEAREQAPLGMALWAAISLGRASQRAALHSTWPRSPNTTVGGAKGDPRSVPER